jgi:hypothetical protein
MTDYKTQNLRREWVKEMEKRLEQFPEYSNLKEFMKQAATEKLQSLENKKLQKKKLQD